MKKEKCMLFRISYRISGGAKINGKLKIVPCRERAAVVRGK